MNVLTFPWRLWIFQHAGINSKATENEAVGKSHLWQERQT